MNNICPRCNKPYEEHRLREPHNYGMERFMSDCGLLFYPEEHTFFLAGNPVVQWVQWYSDTKFWLKHCSVVKNGKIVFTSRTWLPLDITEERLNKLLLLL